MYIQRTIQTTDACACLPTRHSGLRHVFIRARTNQALSH
ncbi:hypothetical protein ABIE21_002017 [Conyzicola nivalis]|jgi:hypothetical protein|uniref:Uncharacterized protein n=1 Tax=Conyzicola nivalis TaxID=1477021 RepID=A0ABV2QPQ0_9MICO